MIKGQRHIIFLLGTIVFPMLLHGQDFTHQLVGRVQSRDKDVARMS